MKFFTSIGVAKNMFYFGKLAEHQIMKDIKKSCDQMTSKGQSKIIREEADTPALGSILLTSKFHRGQPLFVSQGHKISLFTAVTIVTKSICGRYR